MKKIIHITMSGSYGGAESVIFDIIDSQKNKFEFSYISPLGKVKSLIEKKNIIFKEFKISTIKKVLKADKAQLIHAHDFSASVIAAIFSGRKHVISHLHTDHKWLKKMSLKSIAYLLVSFKFKKIIIVSHSMEKETWFNKLIKKKSIVLVNPVDAKSIQKLSNKYQVKHDYDIGFVGRLSDYKDPIRFLNIVKMIKKEKPMIKAFMIGDGDLKDKCIDYIKENNLIDNVEIKGFLENPFPYVKKAKMLVIPSKVEALGLAAAEAMILGTPVVCSKVGGLKDFVHEKNGALCSSDDEFVRGTLKIIDNDILRARLSNESKTVKEYFDFNNYIKKIEEIYSE